MCIDLDLAISRSRLVGIPRRKVRQHFIRPLQDMARLLLPVTEPRTRIDAATWGTMGVGLGSAIAAAVVHHGERAVIAVEGDSAFGFSGMELETMVRCALHRDQTASLREL